MILTVKAKENVKTQKLSQLREIGEDAAADI